MASDPSKTCFVVGPIGGEDSEVRVHADWVLEEIINPVMERFPDFSVARSDKLRQPGLIDTQVITLLLNAELVIADLTTLNPNAFYEIGIRHMAQKPIIHMHKAGEKIPFDISLYRSIEFSLRRPADIKAARANLADAISAVLAPEYKVDNPVTHARGVVKIEESATEGQRVILDEMKGLREKVGSLEDMFRRQARNMASIATTSLPEGMSLANLGMLGLESNIEKAARSVSGNSEMAKAIRRVIGEFPEAPKKKDVFE